MSKTVGRVVMGIGLVIAAIFLVGGLLGSNSGDGSSAPPPSSVPSAEPSSAPVAAASTGPCTTKACIIDDAKQSLIGGVAQNDSVMTKLACVKSTVKHPTAGVWTVRCTATYSSGMVARGVANVLLDKDEATWSPTDIISYGS